MTTVPSRFTAQEGRAWIERQWGRVDNGEGLSLAIANPGPAALLPRVRGLVTFWRSCDTLPYGAGQPVVRFVLDREGALIIGDPFVVRWELNTLAYDEPPSLSIGARTGGLLEIKPPDNGLGEWAAGQGATEPLA